MVFVIFTLTPKVLLSAFFMFHCWRQVSLIPSTFCTVGGFGLLISHWPGGLVKLIRLNLCLDRSFSWQCCYLIHIPLDTAPNTVPDNHGLPRGTLRILSLSRKSYNVNITNYSGILLRNVLITGRENMIPSDELWITPWEYYNKTDKNVISPLILRVGLKKFISNKLCNVSTFGHPYWTTKMLPKMAIHREKHWLRAS